MNTNDAAGVVKVMAAMWPAQEVTEETAALWVKDLLPLDRDAVLASLERLRQSSKWFPAYAEFFDAYRFEAKQARLQQKALPAGESLYDCGRCLEGRGWLEDEDGFVRPCPSCRIETSRRWRERHYSPKHRSDSCPECSAMREGKKRIRESA